GHGLHEPALQAEIDRLLRRAGKVAGRGRRRGNVAEKGDGERPLGERDGALARHMAFEGILTQPDTKPKRWRRAMLSVSLVLHGAALLAGVAHSLWQVEELPMPAVQVLLTA